jgi:ketosteroid isomerase-like protein
MTISDPHAFYAAWAERFNARDLDGMLALYEPGAVFVPQPGTSTTGEDSRQAMAGFLQIGLPITMDVRHVYVAGDLALALVDWSIQGTGADGNPVDLAGTTSDILRLGADGWKLALDNPSGTA